MTFTLKSYKATQKTRNSAPVKNSEKSAGQAAPTVKAGPRNSNGPKGGSSKSSTPANRTYKKDLNVTKAKAPKVTKSKLNTTPKTPFNRSTRLNYRQLRRK